MKLVLLQSSNTPIVSPRTAAAPSPTATRHKQVGKHLLSHDSIDEREEDVSMADSAAGGGGDPASAQSNGEVMTDEQKTREKQDKIMNAQFEGWKNSCKRLRQTADKLEKEQKQLTLANKELKLLLHQALDGDTKAPALSNLVVKRITKSRLNNENDVQELLAK